MSIRRPSLSCSMLLRFRQSWLTCGGSWSHWAEKSKKEVLERKFQDLFEKAKQGPVGPMKRSIDLD